MRVELCSPRTMDRPADGDRCRPHTRIEVLCRMQAALTLRDGHLLASDIPFMRRSSKRFAAADAQTGSHRVPAPEPKGPAPAESN